MSALSTLAWQIAQRGDGPVFGVPGSGATLTLLDHLERHGKDFVLTHFEGAAAIMAGTFGRLTGRAGVCLSIKGPGLTNMVPGLAVAHFDGLPLVALAEAYGPGTSLAKAHKRLDQKMLTAVLVKAWTQLTVSGPSFEELAARAEAESPGPVLLELAQPAPESAPPLGDGSPVVQAETERGLQLVERARRPILVAGTLAIRQAWSNLLNALRIPTFSTAGAKGVVDETLPHAAGVFTGVGRDFSPEHVLLPDADLVIGLGLRPQEMLATKPFGCSAINIAAVSEPGEDAFAFDAVLPPAAAPAVFERLMGKEWGVSGVAGALANLRKCALKDGFLPAHVFESVSGCFGKDVCAVFDTGYFCTMAEHLWQATSPDRCLLSGQGRYMGTSVPMGIAASLYRNDRPTVVFVGDGGIGPFVAEARLAVERKLPLLICLLSDGRFGSIRTRALTDGLTEKPLTIAQPSWIDVFESFGFHANRAHAEDSFVRALESWDPAKAPGYIECVFDPDHYEAMVKGIR
jgi:acetolactate synthase-1/2/3 large subunit